ncbi:hypothetical protein EST38_g2833 [Candolleomyces aberdarensis]|uniref:Fungal-type protein kinase domain-containing protein n=1 Tax=Candolleomyces aberdarensis TaxID=2316362 RepID=A0A4Q2DSJ6_9AGAR|nr:hypothetical protein EST38_g2833 [Candolleomyces aberdarensis]
MKEQRELIMIELEGAYQLEDNNFARSLYHDLASDSAIDSFLKKSRFYDITQRRWKLPQSFTKLLDSNPCAPFFNIVSSIVKHFWHDATAEGTRRVVDTHATDLPHIERRYPNHSSRPSIVIKAEGPSFQLPQTKTGDILAKLGFSNVAACIEIQAEGSELPTLEQAIRVGTYARQIFGQQPNREFVRMLFLTEQHLRLFHFDSSGLQCTPPIDFHEEPHTFVRLVVGLSSPNESDLGLDTSVQWTIEDGRKASGTLTTRVEDGNTKKVYALRNVEPVFCRSYFHGRGTKCWSVIDYGTGKVLFVKDSWRCDHRTSEYVHLKKALGVPGVVQMISCEDDRRTTRELRGFKEGDIAPEHLDNHTSIRVVTESYSLPVFKFTDAKQVLCIFRDAIAGHREMLKAGTLHRDVSLPNILQGEPGAGPGNRGILIDFDMATSYDPDGMSNAQTDWTIGHPKFQSVMVLLSRELGEMALVHDNLDDLESFLYVYTHIIHERDSSGEFHPLAQMDPLRLWDKYQDNPKIVAKLKRKFLAEPQGSTPKDVEDRWPKECLDVLEGFKAYMAKVVIKCKMRLIDEAPVNTREKILKELRLSYEKHYKCILRLFDEGIAALERVEAADAADKDGDDGGEDGDDGGDAASTASPPPPPAAEGGDDASPPSPPPAEGNSLKRPREEELEEELPRAKRATLPGWSDVSNPFI